MLWHRQAIFESKGDKLSSSAESRIRTRDPRHLFASRLNARWQTDWAIEDQAKNLNSTARPYDQRAFSPLGPTVSWLSHPITFYRISGDCAVPGLNATFCFLWFTNCVCVMLFDISLILGCLWPLVYVLNNTLILGIWFSTIPHLPGCFCPWTFFENIEFNTVLTDPFSYLTWIFCRGVSCFATDCPYGVWWRGFTTCLHVGLPFGNRIKRNSWAHLQNIVLI